MFPTIAIPLKNGNEYPVYESDIEEWARTYTHLDVRYELRRMKAWCIANPKRTKSESDIERFIIGWLENGEKQEREKPKTKGKPGFGTFEQRIYDFKELEKSFRAN